MKVCVIGLGYIGFPTACLVARAGHEVLGVDVSGPLVSKLNNGGLHIVNEAGLEELVQIVQASRRLKVDTCPSPADVFIIAVPTPFQDHPSGMVQPAPELPATSYRADLSYVRSAARAIAPHVAPGNLVILESTVPPGTTEDVVMKTLADAGVDASGLMFAHAPERVLPGNIVYELEHNDRIVGGLTPEAGEAARDFYQSFVKGEVLVTDATTAELVKLMENTFRDVNIALANEFALVCEQLGVDSWEAFQLANRHPRVKFLRPGPGVGGHCIAVDPYFVIEAAPGVTPLIQAARRVNRGMPLHVVSLFDQLMNGAPVRKVALLGASYKANVGDERESPALEVAHLLAQRGVQVAIHDPYVEPYRRDVAAILDGADAILVLTDHREYGSLDPIRAATLVSQRRILDTRGFLNANAWRAAGFRVKQLGSGLSSKVAVES